jgi:8-oxo-dGTP diphosphatase/2-hydroxy-dATP diphosphatase
MKIITTNCLVHQPPKILLGMKKRSFGEGRWNGFGGKLLEGESLEESARREVKEECGIEIEEMELVGVLDFEYVGKDKSMEVNIFKITQFAGDPKETEEMKPQWFESDDLPFDQMWPDDKYWMPLFLYGKKFKGSFLFEGFDTIIKYELKEVETL